ncbi:hypothetical protein [Halorientalis salina]|uniref:hypothetical protein n=1 Tax=Halorientalis salina TaxID=2932266 RepID=UPI0010ADA04D|nr:hypothetical protein [Halorientalis salina]
MDVLLAVLDRPDLGASPPNLLGRELLLFLLRSVPSWLLTRLLSPWLGLYLCLLSVLGLLSLLWLGRCLSALLLGWPSCRLLDAGWCRLVSRLTRRLWLLCPSWLRGLR